MNSCLLAILSDRHRYMLNGGISYLILVDKYSKWSKVILLKLAATVTIFNSLRQVFATHEIPKVIVPRNFAQFSSIRFEGFYCGLNITLLHSPFNLICLDELLVKRQLLVSQEQGYICRI